MKKQVLKRLACSLMLLLYTLCVRAQHRLQSPDGLIAVTVQTGNKITYAIQYKSNPLVAPSRLDLVVNNGDALLTNARVRTIKQRSVNTTITSPVPEKRKVIPEVYNELRILFNRPVSLVLRAYNDGVAYRFETSFHDSVVVQNEVASFRFPAGAIAYYPQVQPRKDADIFHTSFEENYSIKPLDSMARDSISFTPVLVDAQAAKVVVTESDLEDYPGMFVRGEGDALSGVFAPYPLEESIVGGEFPQKIVTKRADYIARTKGARTFPWRVLAITDDTRNLPVNDIVYRLAAPSRVPDVSWIKPGKSTEEWIIGINLFNVPFKSGINTATYKYYIDFAKRFRFDRILFDAGWSSTTDLFKVTPTLNIDSLSAYAKSQNIGLSMWTLALTLDRQLDSALDQFNKWGVDFIMTDFIDRDDQKAVNFFHRVAQACAKHKIMLMYHGAFKPAGFNRTYPHALTREGVLGSEFNGWSYRSTPDHNVLQPFIRMVSGPMDYEPGLLDNGTQETFRPIWNKVMSQGTRTHQLAMFVVYDSPMQLFSGNPSQGLLEPAFMELLGSIPTTWDETLIPDAKLGEYIITARKKGRDWFVGAMTNRAGRTLTIPLSFLEEGTYKATICADGINADKWASDYSIQEQVFKKGDTLNIKLAPGGGYLVRLRKE
jgi:alpha-glucosidase